MLAEDDEIHNVNDEKVEEEPATEGDDEDSQEDGMIGICDPYHCHSLSPSPCAPGSGLPLFKIFCVWVFFGESTNKVKESTC